MNILRIVFVILLMGATACTVVGALDKRRNVGFLITSVCIMASNVMCFIHLGVQNPKEASNVLYPYYILHAWFLFAFLFMLTNINHMRKFFFMLIPAGLACLYQTYLVISQYMGARIFLVQKRIYFRTAFFIVTDDSKNLGLFFSYRSYRIMSYLVLAMIIFVLAICFNRSNKVFRPGYIALFGVVAGYSITEILTIKFSFPIWMPVIIHNIILAVSMFYIVFFARNRLRGWSLNSFANDMTDGLILYDRYNDLVHINDMIRNTLSEDLVESFEDKKKLEKWLSVTENDDKKKIIRYENGGKLYYFSVTEKNIGESNRYIGTLYILHDTTDSLVRIKAVEKANAELERASRMKSDFLANMSHEIRTPMNAVIGMAELAMREKEQAKLQDYLLQIQNSGKNLLNIINDILDYSKIESGKMEIIEEEYEPFTEYSDIANVLATRIVDKQIEFFFVIDGILPHKLRGDAMRIRQVIINLANNAIKFTKAGMVQIRLKCEPMEDGRVNMVFHVTDTGIGIKKEDIGKLFVSFQQLDSKRNRNVEGTGLGLAISQRLVQAMNGTIGVESEYGKGSDFWFTVPQTVIDDKNEIEVENAADKNAFVIEYTDGDKAERLVEELNRLGVKSTVLGAAGGYVPTGRKDFVFFKEHDYDERIKALLDNNRSLVGIVLVEFDSAFVPDKENLHIMRKPETSMNMANILNERFDELRKADEKSVFRYDFTAPSAKILVVDDNAINISIAEGLMAPLKVDVDKAGGGQEAIDKVKAGYYDIVFMDHMMPEVDGVDAAKQIRAAGDSIHQPVIIALSANVMEEARKLFAEAGMDDFVGKPIDVRVLTGKLRNYLPAEKIIEGGAEENAESQDNVLAEDSSGAVCDSINIEGVDVSYAVRAFGSSALYDKIAAEYLRSGPEKLKGIEDAFNSRDWADYTIKVHALKSSSRQIGAMALGDEAEKLEKAGKTDDIETIMSDTDKTLDIFKDLLTKLDVYYGEDGDDSDKPPIDKDTLSALCDELDAFCDELDMDGMESVGGKLKEYSFDEEMKEDISSLLTAIGDMDTDGCTEITARLRQAL